MLKYLQKTLFGSSNNYSSTISDDEKNGGKYSNTDELISRYKQDYLSESFASKLSPVIARAYMGAYQERVDWLTDDATVIFFLIKRANLLYYLDSNGYLQTLIVKYRQLFFHDDYGDPNFSDVDREIDSFIDSRLMRILDSVKDGVDEFYIKRAEKSLTDSGENRLFELYYSRYYSDVDDYEELLKEDLRSDIQDLIFKYEECYTGEAE